MTPTDADRALAREWWYRDCGTETIEYIESLAVFRAQARREGAEAILKVIREKHHDPNERLFECLVEGQWGSCPLCAAIRALPSG